MKAGRSYRRPVCSVDHSHTVQHDENNQWVCIDCANDYIREVINAKVEDLRKSEGGVELPEGVKDERMTIDARYQDSVPNRAARRRMMRRG